MEQLQKLYSLLRGHLGGLSLTQSLEQIQLKKAIDPEENLNKLDDNELAKRKEIMDELFEKNRKKKDDPDFVYNVEVDFPQDEELESCGWDADSDGEFWPISWISGVLLQLGKNVYMYYWKHMVVL